MKRFVLILLACVLALLPLTAGYAYTPQTVYTYDFYGNAVALKEMYRVDRVLSGADIGAGQLSSPQGMYLGHDGMIYLCDSGNGRVLVLDRQYRLTREIKAFIRPDGTEDTLNYPTDVCLASNGDLYIADLRAQRIVAVNALNEMTLEIKDVKSDVLPAGYQFRPSKLVLDSTDRLYVVATGVTNGMMELDRDGTVRRFIGAAKVTVNLTDYLWKLIATDEQYSTMSRSVPTEYNNVTLTEDDFLFGTISVVDDEDVKNVISGSMYNVDGKRIKPETLSEYVQKVVKIFNPSQKEAGYTIKKLNLKGNDILIRNGYQAPVGDVQFYMGGDTSEYTQGKVITEIKASMDNMTDTSYIASTDLMGTTRGSSQFVDVAVHQSGVYSVLDQRRGRIFTYDDEGVLLYVFGGKGDAEGLFTMPTAITYVDDNIWVMDAIKGTVTVFQPTSFVNDIFAAYDAYEDGDYEGALKLWNNTIKYCSNFDVGYIGAGRCLLRLGRYEDSMEAFKLAQYRDGYDNAYVMHRSALIKAYFGPALLVFFLLLVAIWLGKKLLRGKFHIKREFPRFRRYWRSLAYAKYTSFHPFDGFYDLKFEQRGTVAAATTILLLNVVVTILKRQLTSFTFNANVISELDILSVAISVVLPVLLFVAANWSVTTLLDGEGSVKNIYICICYAMLPMILLNLLGVVMSNALALREMSFLTLVDSIGTLWFGFLLIFGTGVTHQYSVKRNLLALLLTVVGMLIIIFVTILFFTLIEKIASFGLTLSNEIMLRN